VFLAEVLTGNEDSMSDLTITGVDIATRTGIAVWRNEEIIYTSEITSSRKEMLYRGGDIAAQVLAVLKQHASSMVVIEGYSYASRGSIVQLVELGTVVRYFLLQNDFVYREIAPNTLKKFVTGKGNAKKETMMLEVYKRWGVDPTTNNIADAVGLAYLGAALHGKVKMPVSHMAALKSVQLTAQKV
jgi:crossover junction endodeoxyribonuclease RuvC